MKRTHEQIRALVGLLESDVDELPPLIQENERAEGRVRAGARDSLDFAALGYTVHNLYTFFENYLLRIAKAFESRLELDVWHTELLDRMASEVPEVRPRFFSSAEVRPFHELRGFRHVFRNVYRTRLDPGKVMQIQTVVPEALRIFKSAHKRYCEQLLSLARRIEESE